MEGNLFKVVVISVGLLFTTSQINAQDEDKPWAISIGINAVDYYPVGQPDPQGDLFDEFFNATDHWNIFPLPTRLEVSRYWSSRFSFSASGSFNSIEKFGSDIDPVTGVESSNKVDDLSYYAIDGAINYSFTDGKSSKFEPYISGGGGYTWLNDIGSGTLNGSLGIKYWFSESFAINLQSTYKHVFETYGFRHFQHSLSLSYKFGKKDADGDGIEDEKDKCPEKPGLLIFNGCPDTDNDGIDDTKDQCPETPGVEALNGCPDADGDGITDKNDQCPDIVGVASLNGCPDSDDDGITDEEDKCPNKAGPYVNSGCPWPDADNDGIPDKDDQCPNEAGTAKNNGCKEFTKEEENLLNEYARVILFTSGKAIIKEESKDVLQDIVTILKNNSGAKFVINGYTDSIGSKQLNLQLSKHRALAVKDYLIENGISAKRLESNGYGESNPIATNTTSQGRKKNRRVEITLVK